MHLQGPDCPLKTYRNILEDLINTVGEFFLPASLLQVLIGIRLGTACCSPARENDYRSLESQTSMQRHVWDCYGMPERSFTFDASERKVLCLEL